MYVPEIIEVKEHLENLKKSAAISSWELPYENILTRRSAAIFFVSFPEGSDKFLVWEELSKYSDFSFRENTEQKLSKMEYRITFSKEDKQKNELKEDNQHG